MSMDWNLLAINLGGVVASAALWYCYRLIFKRRQTDIRGKVVLVTGASSGLGEACAKVFYQHGCRVILAGRNEKRLNEVKQALMKLQTEAEHLEPAVLRLDLEDVSGLQRAAAQAVGLFGKVDIVINNAGISYRGCVDDTSVQVDRKLMDVNYFGHVALIKGLLPSMLSQKSGHIVGISSMQGKISIPYRSAYSASKHAFQAFFDCLRAELTDSGIQVSVVSPGYIKTNLSTNAICGDGSTHGVMDKTTESGMSPEAVAEAILRSVVYQQPDVVIAPVLHKIAIVLRAVAPGLYFSIMGRRARKQRKDYKKTE